MLATVATWDIAFTGLVNGLAGALVAMGIVLVYRSSRVINFAVGSMGVPATALFGLMAAKQGWPYWPSLIAAMAVGILTGTVVELVVIRRLARAPRVIVLVATIGVAQLCVAVTLALPKYRTGEFQTKFPLPFEGQWQPGLDVGVKDSELVVLMFVPAIIVGLWWLLGHTTFGEAVRASASNADLARMTGISPKLVSTAVWSIAGFLSFMAIFLTATLNASTALVEIGPQTLVRGMAAALVGGMVSFPRAAIAAIAIGVLERIYYFNFPSETGMVEFVLLVVIIALVARVSRDAEAGGESFQFAPRVSAIPDALRRMWWVGRLPHLIGVLFVVLAVIAPMLSDRSENHGAWTKIIGFAICALSVTVLTGWAGQLSLGQMAFAGMGALSAAALARGAPTEIGFSSISVFDGNLPTLSFPWTMLIGACFAAGLAVIIGIGALRVRGLLLAVSTLAFAIACQAYLFRRPIFSPNGSTSVTLPRAEIGPFDLTDKNRAFYYAALATLVVVMAVLGHLRQSGIGRTIVGVRENYDAASAMTVSPTRSKLTAFALAGFVAGLGGSVIAAAYDTSFDHSGRYFVVQDSLTIVAIAVIGGLGSLSGAVVGALWVVGLPSFFPGNETVPLFVSSIGLLLILLYIPGGFAQIGYFARDAIVRAVARRRPEQPVKSVSTPPTSLTRERTGVPVAVGTTGAVLATRELTVRFGGLVAVNGIDVEAQPGEVIGLIGNNGAGKSTLLNAIGGYVKSSGRVELLGRDISKLRPHQRARIGLGRTFQAATLYPELTVRDTVLVAMEARHRTSFFGTLTVFAQIRPERTRRAEAAELIDFLGLGRYADRHVAELSTGTRRIVELATVLAVAPRVICLDEPTAGVAQREAEAFGPLITSIQRELDSTLLIVEHDLPMIMSISDRVYCLEAGQVIAEGSPEEIRANPRVIASYLGTDERAIMRSDAR
ncbi:MAG: branched-chain amino acid ABC transporter permease/ATP-binding protein [Actinomycetota bacterium]|nr:branched-chain amino acid ABC transporter permease/ATP-binding protein [Actinomycetota bacterium]